MNGVLGIHRLIGEPPEDGEINEMTLLCGHKIRNPNAGGFFLRVRREKTFCFLETLMPERGSYLRCPNFQAGSFNHCTRARSRPVLMAALGDLLLSLTSFQCVTKSISETLLRFVSVFQVAVRAPE